MKDLNKKSSIKELARNLRNNPTAAEKELWQYLKGRQLSGCKFLRQHVIRYNTFLGKTNFFILDFYCAEYKLAVELDGKVHEEQREYDFLRDSILENMGIRVLRIENKELENIEKVLEKIRCGLTHPKLR